MSTAILNSFMILRYQRTLTLDHSGMYIFCIPLGSFVKKRTGSRLIGAVLTAFLFQTLMITSAALISTF